MFTRKLNRYQSEEKSAAKQQSRRKVIVLTGFSVAARTRLAFGLIHVQVTRHREGVSKKSKPDEAWLWIRVSCLPKRPGRVDTAHGPNPKHAKGICSLQEAKPKTYHATSATRVATYLNIPVVNAAVKKAVRARLYLETVDHTTDTNISLDVRDAP